MNIFISNLQILFLFHSQKMQLLLSKYVSELKMYICYIEFSTDKSKFIFCFSSTAISGQMLPQGLILLSN